MASRCYRRVHLAVTHTKTNSLALPCFWRGRGTNYSSVICCSCRSWNVHSPSRLKACGVKVQTISSRGLTVMWNCKWTWCLRWARAQGSSPAQTARHPPPPEPSSCQKTRLTSSRSTSSKNPPSVMSATTWLLVRNNFWTLCGHPCWNMQGDLSIMCELRCLVERTHTKRICVHVTSAKLI